ncbi:hypothetical protein ACGFZB_28635 [Streptomyces cinerochromogenes]|uniref:Uncharacterized protein n=1 Tax=Streptomyces cinerochromogenes TaxID=66422 RepID=A0ABW7BF26_9ACTN
MPSKDVARRSRDDVMRGVVVEGNVMRVDASQVVSVELQDIEHEDQPLLIARGAAYAREYARIEDKPAVLAANVAVVCLALRKQYGDWRGETKEYREAVMELYRQSNVRGDQLRRLKGNVRYHLGNAARRYLTARELRALELNELSPLERQQDRRVTNSAILRAVSASAEAAASTPAVEAATASAAKKTKKSRAASVERVPDQRGPGIVVKATADHLRLAHVAHSLVTQLNEGVIASDMTDGQRAKLDEELAAIESAARRLRRMLKKRSSEA